MLINCLFIESIMDLSILNNIEPIILSEEYIILERDDLYPTLWSEDLYRFPYVQELELIIDFESIKHNLFNCRFFCNEDHMFGYGDKFTLLTVLYLAENTKIIKSKMINGKLKLNIFPEILDCFFGLYTGCASTSLLYNNKCYIEEKRGRFIDCGDDVEIEYFEECYTLQIDTCNIIHDCTVCMFIWFNKIIIDELPIIKINDFYISEDKIKKINISSNYGFYVQLNLLTFEQICSLGKYNGQCIRNKLVKFDGNYYRKHIKIMNYGEEDYVIDQIYF